MQVLFVVVAIVVNNFANNVYAWSFTELRPFISPWSNVCEDFLINLNRGKQIWKKRQKIYCAASGAAIIVSAIALIVCHDPATQMLQALPQLAGWHSLKSTGGDA